MPQKLERNRGLAYVRYDVFIVPVDVAEFMFLSDKNAEKSKPTFISSVKLTSIASSERDKKNGIQAAQKFIAALKQHISTLK